MAAEESRQFITGLASLRASLGPAHFWGVVVGLYVVLLHIMVISAVALNWVTKRFRRHETEPARWVGLDALWIWLIIMGLGILVASLMGTALFEQWMFHVQIVLDILGCFLVCLIPAIVYRQSLSSIGITARSPVRDVLKGGITYLFFLPGVLAVHMAWLVSLGLWGVELSPQPVAQHCKDAFDSGDVMTSCVVVFMAVVAAPVYEELLFRGLLYSWLRGRVPVAAAAVVSGALFGAVHISLLAFVPITVVGIALAFLFERTGSIWSCMVLHGLFNAGMLSLVLFDVV